MKYVDIVFPSDNEQEFCDKAKEIGVTEICFVYEYGVDLSKIKDRLKEFTIKTRIGIKVPHNFTLQQKRKLKGCTFFYKSEKDHLRHVIEQKSADVIYGIEDNGLKEYMHLRNAGLNQVLSKLLAKNKVNWGISFSMLLEALSENRVKLFGRIMQNYDLHQKYGFNGVFASFANYPSQMRQVKDLKSVLVSMGVNEKDVKNMMSNL